MARHGNGAPGRAMSVRLILASIIALVALSCDDAPVAVPVIVAPPQRVDSLYDFFPAKAVGDTMSWHYTMFRTVPPAYGSSYRASGTMLWTIVDKKTAGGLTTMQVSESFTGTVTTITNGVSSNEDLSAFPMSLVITEDSGHVVEISSPPSLPEPWYIPPQARFPRYQLASEGETLVAHPSATTTVRGRKDAGVVSIEYTDGAGGAGHAEQARYQRGLEPVDTVVVPPPPALADFFPAFALGDTVAWNFTSGYSSVTGPGYQVSGIMRWTVMNKTSGTSGTTTTIMQRLSAVWTRWTYSTPETTWISADTTYVSITESPYHWATTRIPLVWQGSPNAWQGSLQTWEISVPRYINANAADTLVAYTGNGVYRASVFLKKNSGPFRFTYDETYLSRTTTDMVRR